MSPHSCARSRKPNNPDQPAAPSYAASRKAPDSGKSGRRTGERQAFQPASGLSAFGAKAVSALCLTWPRGRRPKLLVTREDKKAFIARLLQSRRQHMIACTGQR